MFILDCIWPSNIERERNASRLATTLTLPEKYEIAWWHYFPARLLPFIGDQASAYNLAAITIGSLRNWTNPADLPPLKWSSLRYD